MLNFVNFVYTTVIRAVVIGFISLYFSIVTVGIIVPVTLGVTILGPRFFDGGFLWFVREFFIAANSVLFAFILQLRTLMCRIGVDAQCAPSQRPLVDGLYIYILGGPVITMWVFANDLLVQTSFMMAYLVFHVVVEVYTLPTAHHVYVVFLVIGFYIIAIYLSWYRLQQQVRAKQHQKTIQSQKDEIERLLEKQRRTEKANHAFVTYIFHEVRNPLNNAAMSVSLMQDDIPEMKNVVTDLITIKSIMDDASRYSEACMGLLQAKKEETSISRLAREVVSLLRPYQKKSGKVIRWDVSDELRGAILSIDVAHLKHVLIIILRRALSDGNPVTSANLKLPEVGTRRTEIQLRFETNGDRLLTHIRDTSFAQGAYFTEGEVFSSSMPAAKRMDVFSIESHEVAKDRGGNMALQLAGELLRFIKAEVHWEVAQTSLDLRFYLRAAVVGTVAPLQTFVGDDVSSGTESDEEIDDEQPLRMHVLVVDDDPITRALLGRMLGKLQCTYDSASDGVLALSKISHAISEKGKGRYDCVLLDTMMPRLDGKGVLTQLRADDLDVHVVSLTSNTTDADIAELLALGAKKVLSKPCALETLRKELRLIKKGRSRGMMLRN